MIPDSNGLGILFACMTQEDRLSIRRGYTRASLTAFQNEPLFDHTSRPIHIILIDILVNGY